MEIINYYFAKTLENTDFVSVIEKVTEELKKERFGILTEIDVKATLKKKLDVDFRNYRILGACNPPFAYKALQAENRISAMLPCNVVVQDRGEDKIEVTAVDPAASMRAVGNPSLNEVTGEIRSKLQKVIDLM